MSRRELFQKKSLETRERIPQRPLGEVSTFLVEQFPVLLKQFREGKVEGNQISRYIESLVSHIPQDHIAYLLSLQGKKVQSSIAGSYPFHQQLDQSALDVKFLELGLVNLGIEPPKNLIALVSALSAASGQIPMLTYEDLIYINPESDPRTFTHGEVGNSEYDFYYGHLSIERSLEGVMRQVEYALYQLNLPQPNVKRAVKELERANAQFDKVFQDLGAVGMKMSKEHFAYFRVFFETHPMRQLKGPSGGFTSTIPVLDMKLGGENLDQEYFKYLADNIRYFPRKGQKDIELSYQLIQSGQTLTALASKVGNPSDLLQQIQRMSDLLRQFRGMHYKGVAHQIPEAIEGNLAGTGGEEDPGTFLRKRMRMRHVPENR